VQEAIKVEDFPVQLQLCYYPVTLSLWLVDTGIHVVKSL